MLMMAGMKGMKNQNEEKSSIVSIFWSPFIRLVHRKCLFIIFYFLTLPFVVCVCACVWLPFAIMPNVLLTLNQ